MSDNVRREITPERRGFLQELGFQLKLIARLMADPRVSPFLKIIPVGTLVYWLVPTDLLPIIPLDDAALIFGGLYLFVEMCPDEVVQEHRQAIQRAAAGNVEETPAAPPEEVVDGEYTELGENQERMP